MGIWLDGKEVWDSPVFTGIPVAPTAPPGTNTIQIATTAFVANSVITDNSSKVLSYMGL